MKKTTLIAGFLVSIGCLSTLQGAALFNQTKENLAIIIKHESGKEEIKVIKPQDQLLIDKADLSVKVYPGFAEASALPATKLPLTRSFLPLK